MSNSSLVTYTTLSPNNSGKRTHKIDTITPHCTVGQVSTRWFDYFKSPSVEASCNYGIGTEGGVALCVPEDTVSWCSSSPSNDNRAVTIECASDATDPYAFNSTVYNKLIDLCVDICKRNGKTKLLWLGDKSKTLSYSPKSNEMVLTVHRWFANPYKECPGDWMMARMGDLAKRVTSKLTFVPNGGCDPKPTDKLNYKAHVQTYGWLSSVGEGQTAGSTGYSLRMEALVINSTYAKFKYQSHCQNIGDTAMVTNGQVAGTTGKSLRMEAVRIECDKPILYRAHVQNIGWMPWVSNGQWAGTKGKSLRLEAIEIKYA